MLMCITFGFRPTAVVGQSEHRPFDPSGGAHEAFLWEVLPHDDTIELKTIGSLQLCWGLSSLGPCETGRRASNTYLLSPMARMAEVRK